MKLLLISRDCHDPPWQVQSDQQRGRGGRQLRRQAEPQNLAQGGEHGRVLRGVQGREGNEGLQTQRRHPKPCQRLEALIYVYIIIIIYYIYLFVVFIFSQVLISVCRVRASPQDPISVTGARVMEWSRG